MIRKKHISITRLARIASLLAILGLALATAGLARASISGPNAIDKDGNGYYDAYIREPTLYSAGNVGAACSYSYDANHVFTVGITVRPPRVWPINGFASQQVAWRMVAWNNANPNAMLTAGGWNTGTAYSGQPTEFGGSGDGYPFTVSSTNYWAGSQTMTAPTSLGQWQPGVQVAWLNPNTGTWTYGYLLVHSALISGSTAIPVC
jgi:hypothetical protein